MNFHSIIASSISNIAGEKILDVGFAQKPNYKIKSGIIYGLDVQSVVKPNNYYEVKCVNLNSDPIPYEDNFFDTVIVSEVIEHVENPTQLLQESNRVLRAGGRLIISTPQANYLYDILKNIIFSFFRINLDRDPGYHLSNWTILDFVRLLKKNSFQIKKIIGGSIHFPFGVNISVPWFPILGWQVMYVCEKMGEPKKIIYTKDEQLNPREIKVF